MIQCLYCMQPNKGKVHSILLAHRGTQSFCQHLLTDCCICTVTTDLLIDSPVLYQGNLSAGEILSKSDYCIILTFI